MRSARVSPSHNRKQATVMRRIVTSCLLLLSINGVIAMDSPTSDLFKNPFSRDQDVARNINLKRSPDPEIHHKRRYKHPLLITKDDIEPQEAVVEDNVIVESNILKLVRPRKNEIRYQNPSLTPHKRVTRGWNLQYVIVPQQYYFYPQKKTTESKKKPYKYYY